MSEQAEDEAQPKIAAPATVRAASWGNITLAGPSPFAQQGPAASFTSTASSNQQDSGALTPAWPSLPSSTSSSSTASARQHQQTPSNPSAPAATPGGPVGAPALAHEETSVPYSYRSRRRHALRVKHSAQFPIIDPPTKAPAAAHGVPVQAPDRTHETLNPYEYSSRQHALRVDHSAPFPTSDAPAKSYSFSVRIGNNHATDIHKTWRRIYQTFDTLGNAMLAIRADDAVVAEGGRVGISILRADGRVLKTQIQPMGYQQRKIIPALWAEVHEFEVERGEGGSSEQVSNVRRVQ